MRIKFMGKYNEKPDSLPKKAMVPGAKRIKKIDNLIVLTIVMTILSCILLYVLGIFLVNYFGQALLSVPGVFAAGLSLQCLVPHEYIHAICFKEEAYIYIANGLMFAMSPEHMSKRRYLFMVFLPFTVLGVVPFCLGLIFHCSPLAIFGAVSIIPCTGDLYLALNSLFQVPSNGKIYLYDMVNYWYIDQ